jgi:hypothetical protein
MRYCRFQDFRPGNTLLEIINEVYIDARYPADLGLMPNGKPTAEEAETFISFTENLYDKLIRLIK